MKPTTLHWKIIISGLIGLMVLLCFQYAAQNQFTNWDDDYYITHDPYIKSFTAENLKVIFTKDITKNNYHPFCMLSLAINYYFSGMNPAAYYLTNVAIHMLNAILVFMFIFQLCSMLKMNGQARLFIGAMCGLWFGIHPMHVESVCWIAERKDVLYAFFYIIALITYLKYIDTTARKWIFVTLVLYICSCLSKPMAVVFPVSLLALDVLLNRQLKWSLFSEKAVFFAASLLFGGMAVYTQRRTGAIADFGVITFQERIMYACYGFDMYIAKLFNPTYLSTFYPYPYRYVSGYLPGIYYAAPFIAIGIPALPLYLTYKFNKSLFRVVLFGLGFFAANVVFVLQFISCGAAIMADRYSYVAYIGLLFLVAYLIQMLITRFSSFKTIIIASLALLSGVMGYMCYQRTMVWHDSESLYTDAIEKYPYRALLSYQWLGNYYLDIGQLDKAMENYNVLTTLHAARPSVLANIERIKVLKQMGIVPGASGSNSATSELPVGTAQQTPVDKEQAQAHIDSCVTKIKSGDTLAALRQYVMAIRFNQGAEQILYQAGFKMVQDGQWQPSINMFNMLLKLNSGNPFFYFYRGVAEFNSGRMQIGMADWETSLKFKSKDVLQSASYNLCVAYDSLKNGKKTMYYLNMAKESGYPLNAEYEQKLRKKWEGKK